MLSCGWQCTAGSGHMGGGRQRVVVLAIECTIGTDGVWWLFPGSGAAGGPRRRGGGVWSRRRCLATRLRRSWPEGWGQQVGRVSSSAFAYIQTMGLEDQSQMN